MKTIAAYATLLALALVAEASLLRAGRGLRAPVSLGGTWEVRTGGSGGVLPNTQTLSIEQTGPDLDLHLGNVALRGSLHGTAIRAWGATSFSGRLDGDAIRGRFEPEGATFVAARVREPRGETRAAPARHAARAGAPAPSKRNITLPEGTL
ncbi:MAG: hypothetical protein JO197_13325 [Acidobacteria bacterium]|nr:hypothetical protein [Acidobacteriota bacterium]MBV9477676.1 hypothetical protein [Acidobacteriota bacterium]